MFAGEGSTLGFPERLSGTLSSWSHCNSLSRLGRNIPVENKSIRYNGNLEWGLFFAKFRTLARYYGWNDDDSLLALSVSVEGPALRYFHILSFYRERLTFGEIISRFMQRFSKGTLRAAHHLEFSFMTQWSEESVEQWGDRVVKAAHYALGASVSGSVLWDVNAMYWQIKIHPEHCK